MIPPLTRAVCHLSIACLLSARPVRPLAASVTRHSPLVRQGSATSLLNSKRKQASTRGHSHQSVQAMQTQAWQYPKPITFPCKTKHSATVIILHGLGDTGRGWSDFGPMLQASMPHIKFVFPTAPTRPVTLNGGMRMTGWFDIKSLTRTDLKEDDAGLNDAASFVKGLIKAEEAEGIPSNRVLIAGFSQGGAVSLLMLRSKVRLAAVLAMSTWLPLADQQPILSTENQQTPVLMCHGNADQVVQYAFGQESYQRLKQAGSSIDFKTFQGLGHGVDPREVQDITGFIAKHLPSV